MAVSDNGLDEISDMDSAEEAWLDLEATPGPGEECDPQWAHEGQDEARQVVRADFPVRAAPDCPSPSQQLACVALEEDHAYNDTVWEQSCYGETESSHTCQSVDADDVMLFNERHWHLQRIFKTKLENLTPQEKGNAVIITVFGVSWDLYDLDDQSVLALAGTNRWLRRRFQLADPLRLFDISLSFPVDDNLTLSTQKVRKLSRLVESLQTGWLDDRGILFRFVVTLSFEPIKSHPDGVPGQPYHEWLSAVVDLLTGLPLRPAHVKVRDSLCDKFVEAVRDRGFAVLDGRDTLQVIRSTLTVLYDDRDRTHTWVSRQAVLARMDAYPELTELFTSLVNWKLHGIEEEV
ncbi:hypothetical protein DACRYDRAFT_23243 [Dacryopinax primogenitus]|uniref:Uncharacterized protein n=1 Tax=Dacryopinax primogenitus (strain DJM 731) TaxID=1858805 RepID=M5FVI8_DACPD|nr:uncharacterized protein DACRYDRAFT_23243 [Dacryopinax primogenitus]EJU00314.1 hypothetical protein DACRYDRAFT_23243 [Dacryopinax primogenitus]